MKRLKDRYNVESIRFTREGPYDVLDRGLLEVVDSILPGGSIFHVFEAIPDDSGDVMMVVIDGETVIKFEIPRINFKEPRLVSGPPCDVEIEALDDYRRRMGQGKHRMFLDHVVADARRLLAENSR